MKKLLIAAICGSFLLQYPVKVIAEDEGEIDYGDEITEAVGINVEYHSIDEIKAYVNENGPSYLRASYDEEPDTANPPYAPGKLKDEVLNDALKAVNTIRYIAGLNYSVSLDSSYTEKCQAGSLINAINGALSHTPDKPEGMSDELYQLGYSGTSSSNIAMGYSTLSNAVVSGWLNDGDSSNISRVGHRRWLLNAAMTRTGFGQVGRYTSMYAFDRNGSSSATSNVWPAQNTPLEFFGTNYPWSISTGNTEDASKITVHLTDMNTSQTYTFSEDSSDGYFNVENSGYGIPGAIIWRPSGVSYSSGDKYAVSIEGLTIGEVSYTVNFFNLADEETMTVSPDTLTMEVGETAEVDVIFQPASSTDYVSSWNMSYTSRCFTVTHDDSGRFIITATATGSGTVTFTSANGLSAACRITITQGTIHPTGITVTPPSLNLYEGDTGKLTADVSPSNAANRNVKWSSSDTSVATVDSTGNVTAISQGSAVITAETEDGGLTATASVTVSKKPVSVTSVTVSPDSLELSEGGSGQLTAEVLPENADNKAVSWSSSDTSVATVDSSGLVSAVSAGTADITVTTEDGGFKAVCKVTVIKNAVRVTGVTVSPETLELYVGENGQLTAEVLPENADNKAVSWSSSDTSAASVDSSGLVSAVSAGTADITVTAEDGGFKAVCRVTVSERPVPVAGVSITPEALNLKAGETAQLTAVIQPENATNKKVSWLSDDIDVAIADETGRVTAVAPGTATVTVYTDDGNYTAECKVTVTAQEIPVTGVTVSPESVQLEVGETAEFTASVIPDDASNQTVTWSCDNTEIAEIDESGKLTAKAPGTASVTVMTNDGGFKATASVTVTGIPHEHAYVLKEWIWAEDYTSAKAVFVCSECGDETEVDALITADGNRMIATVVFEGETYTDVKETEETEKPVTGIKLDVSEIRMLVGEPYRLYAEVIPSDADNRNVIFSSDSEDIVSVDQNGYLTSKKPGLAKITVTSEEGGFTAECMVRVLFTDVSLESQYFYEPVYWAVDHGITVGYGGPDLFSPSRNCTREQIVTFLWRLMKEPEPKTSSSFTDVEKDAWYYKPITWAYENHITTGLNDGTGRFGVGQPCTREQCVTFLYRAAESPDVAEHQEFTDVENGRYFYDSISWAASKGITVGLNDGTGRFGVGMACTRAMIVTFLYRYAN